jgi:hypothetical protein
MSNMRAATNFPPVFFVCSAERDGDEMSNGARLDASTYHGVVALFVFALNVIMSS